jgi:succinoglycan biosynthesis transport protein ExoP
LKAAVQAGASVPRRIPEARFQDYWYILSSRKWLIILAVGIVLAGSMLYLQMVVPTYQAKATLLRQQSDATFSSADVNLPYLPSSSVENVRILFKSKFFVDEIAEGMAAKGFVLTPAKIIKSISLSVPAGQTDILIITATAESATKAMVLANTSADVYTSKMSELKSASLDRAESFLSEQMQFVNENLIQAEKELSDFKEREGIYGMYEHQGSFGLIRELGDLYAELVQTQTDKAATQMKLDVARQLLDEKKEEMTSVSSRKLTSKVESLQSLIANWQVELSMLQQQDTEDYPAKSSRRIDLEGKIATAQSDLDALFQELRLPDTQIDPLSEWRTVMEEFTTLDIELKGLEHKENTLDAKIKKFKADHSQLADQLVELARLERTVRIHEETYMLLVNRYEEIGMLKRVRSEEITVIDEATMPRSPIKPNKRLAITLGIMIGLVSGFGGAFFLEYIDNSLKVEKDIEKFLAMPVVGNIPMIEAAERGNEEAEERGSEVADSEQRVSGSVDKQSEIPSSSHFQKRKKRSERRHEAISNLIGRVVINLDSESPVAESYKALRTNIQFASVDKESKTILVSSAVPSEGKSLTVANLAITMALMGAKTLMLDADLRRSRLHSIFQQEREPGLSELLTSYMRVEIPPSQVSSLTSQASCFVRTTGIDNLYLLPSGKRPPNPTELLSSDRMLQLMEELKSEFEVILLDSPPIVPVTDASVLASEIAHIVLLVVRSGETKREVAQVAQEILQRVDANIFGVVLNAVDYTRRSVSYYRYHYYYSRQLPPE